MKWTYYKENICSDRPVAKFCNEKGAVIFYVGASRDSYFTQPRNEYIKSVYLSYSESRLLNTKEEESGESTDVLFAALKHACEYFEKDYYNQVEKIRTELMF